MPTTKVEDFEVIDHGPEHSQYFQGCGVSCTEFTDVATGIGDSRYEAFSDALEQLALAGWDVEPIGEAKQHGKNAKLSAAQRNAEEYYWHISIRVK